MVQQAVEVGQRGDLTVIEQPCEPGLDGASVTDVHLSPKRSTAFGQLDFDGAVVIGIYVAVTPHPALLFQTIEATTQA